MLELLPVKRQTQATGVYWGSLHMYVGTRVTTHPCNEHMESLSHMSGSIGNAVQGGGGLGAVVSEVELSYGPEVYESFL